MFYSTELKRIFTQKIFQDRQVSTGRKLVKEDIPLTRPDGGVYLEAVNVLREDQRDQVRDSISSKLNKGNYFNISPTKSLGGTWRDSTTNILGLDRRPAA